MQQGSAFWVLNSKSLDSCRVRAIAAEIILLRKIGRLAFQIAVQMELFRAAVCGMEASNLNRMRHRVFGHFSIGGPLSSGNRHQTALTHKNFMAARN